jgi:acyl-CoA hydrolase
MHQGCCYHDFPHAGNLMTAAMMHFDNDPAPLRRMDMRFLRPDQSGETIRTDIWIKKRWKSSISVDNRSTQCHGFVERVF